MNQTELVHNRYNGRLLKMNLLVPHSGHYLSTSQWRPCTTELLVRYLYKPASSYQGIQPLYVLGCPAQERMETAEHLLPMLLLLHPLLALHPSAHQKESDVRWWGVLWLLEPSAASTKYGVWKDRAALSLPSVEECNRNYKLYGVNETQG